MDSRFDVFYALEDEKKQRILNAALDEFSEKGYKDASTNTIAQKAQIGKGMLFYYFGSKEELFHFLCEYTIEFVKHDYLDKFQFDSRDFIERYLQMSELKKTMLKDYRPMLAFFESFYWQKNERYIEKYLGELTYLQRQFRGRLSEDLDMDQFRPGIDPQHAMKYIDWLLERYTAEMEKKVTSREIRTDNEQVLDDEWQQYEEFLKDLRKAFY